jgi:hypothetical protein
MLPDDLVSEGEAGEILAAGNGMDKAEALGFLWAAVIAQRIDCFAIHYGPDFRTLSLTMAMPADALRAAVWLAIPATKAAALFCRRPDGQLRASRWQDRKFSRAAINRLRSTLCRPSDDVNARMLDLAKQQYPRKLKKPDAIARGQLAGMTWREADAAYRALPPEYRHQKTAGRPPNK